MEHFKDILRIYKKSGYDLALSYSRNLLIDGKISFNSHNKISESLSSFEVMPRKVRKILLDKSMIIL